MASPAKTVKNQVSLCVMCVNAIAREAVPDKLRVAEASQKDRSNTSTSGWFDTNTSVEASRAWRTVDCHRYRPKFASELVGYHAPFSEDAIRAFRRFSKTEVKYSSRSLR